jgi:hypothetical protein
LLRQGRKLEKGSQTISVADPGCSSKFFSRIPDPESRIPNPGSKVKTAPDPGSVSATRNLNIFYPKIVSKLSEICPGRLSRIQILLHPGSRIWIPNPGVKKALDPGSGYATLQTIIIGSVSLSADEAEGEERDDKGGERDDKGGNGSFL